jgi:hypothetical protein
VVKVVPIEGTGEYMNREYLSEELGWDTQLSSVVKSRLLFAKVGIMTLLLRQNGGSPGLVALFML